MTDDKAEDGSVPEGSADLAKLNEKWEALGGKNTDAAFRKAMSSLGQPYTDLQERMKALTSVAGAGSSLGTIAEQLTKQQRTLEAMRPTSIGDHLLGASVGDTLRIPEPPRVSDVHMRIPPSPILETNKQLGRIEDRFEQLQDVATDAAKIATGLQAAAAEFLFKFEKAVSDNDTSTRRAFRVSTSISIAAIVIAVATPFIQTLYEPPDSAPALQAAVEEMQAELVMLREAQAAASDRLTEALAASDQDAASVLRDIRDLLSAPPVPAPEEP